MSKLSEALAALDKATPGPWTIKKTEYGYADILGNELFYSGITGQNTNVTVARVYRLKSNSKVVAAAPDALAWIKEALPLMEKLIEPIDEYLGTVAGGDVNYFHEQLDLYEKTKALIARAKPEV